MVGKTASVLWSDVDCVVRTDDKKILELLIPYHASNKNIFFKESGDFFFIDLENSLNIYGKI